MNDIDRQLLILVTEAAWVHARHMQLSQRALWGYVVARRAVLYGGVVCAHDVALSAMLSVPLVVAANMAIATVEACGGEVMGRGVAMCEVGEIVEKELDVAGLRMEDVILSQAAIAQAVLEELEEAEEGDGNEEKGWHPTAHREFVERIKENQGKLEEAMELLIVEALGLSGLRCGLTICALIQKNPVVEVAANCRWADDESARLAGHAAFAKPAGCTGEMAEILLRLNNEEIFDSVAFGDLYSACDKEWCKY
ncbi:uncharacterized protein MONOS_13549 [Monocercomonoides exilis]|uniref:uncharacterized protein n=1 Tax=Monocercomonoides exilis TaxID=2049356 RepID=UPI0035597BDC|nr:hypothetical protein MONOS_13549 [Monocercomonoides exilis]|eukprot:MONOS_13549.1-p1 / transcript=MONOS_13549.1 / gene=MONOS_13549 / organism=Monocercomonoides_exilis_PA203 / gene_product=unspecified product / transcript_product=unspecified product / location=Mono_scaffold00843:21809-23036(-) / protein_length=253 / sequence_SO=supercontig / SO=protein_coding / is_pseudo=false